MTVTIFPCNTPQRVPLPLPQIPGSLPSWRVIFGREMVPVFVEGQSEGAADDEGYFPVNAVYLEARPCQIAACPDVKSFLDDGLARCSVFLNQAFIVPPDGEKQLPQELDFKIRGAGAGLGTTLVRGTINLLDAKDVLKDPLGPPSQRGLIAAVSGILFNQFELWARVQDTGNGQPVQVRVMMIVDRLGGQMAAFLGEIAGGGDLPIINPAGP